MLLVALKVIDGLVGGGDHCAADIGDGHAQESGIVLQMFAQELRGGRGENIADQAIGSRRGPGGFNGGEGVGDLGIGAALIFPVGRGNGIDDGAGNRHVADAGDPLVDEARHLRGGQLGDCFELRARGALEGGIGADETEEGRQTDGDDDDEHRDQEL